MKTITSQKILQPTNGHFNTWFTFRCFLEPRFLGFGLKILKFYQKSYAGNSNQTDFLKITLRNKCIDPINSK